MKSFLLLNSFDIYSTYNFENSYFNNVPGYIRVRFLIFAFIFITIYSLYSTQYSNFNFRIAKLLISNFNTQLKGAFYFEKINILNWMFLLFWFILTANCLGLIPETIALNSIFIVTIFLSFWMSFTYNFYGISIKKEKWFDLFLPSNIPLWITPLLTILEIISYFIRVFSLAIRLFANILAGHILIHLLISYLAMMLNSLNIFLIIISFSFMLLIFLITLLEWFMAFMQSAIFVLLLSMWFNENLQS